MLLLLFASSLVAFAETDETISKKFDAQPGGRLIVEVDFGSIEINTNAANEITVEILRKITRENKAAEEAFLREHPVKFAKEGNTLTISSQAKPKLRNKWERNQRNEAKYTITVPAQFEADLKTAGGPVSVNDLHGDVQAKTGGGSFSFSGLRGVLDAHTAGGPIQVKDCEGPLKLGTSGGRIEVAEGGGSLKGDTAGGPVNVRNFRGPATLGSGGGGITLENVTGRIEATTSGGPISAQFSAPLSEEVRLQTSGGTVNLSAPENSAFDLDASTAGGRVESEWFVTGNKEEGHVKKAVNGGGKPVILRSSGGSIHVRKS